MRTSLETACKSTSGHKSLSHTHRHIIEVVFSGTALQWPRYKSLQINFILILILWPSLLVLTKYVTYYFWNIVDRLAWTRLSSNLVLPEAPSHSLARLEVLHT